MKPEEVNAYLKELADRYAQLSPANDTPLKGNLHGAMTGLCSSRSACKEAAAQQFGGLFDRALTDRSEPTVRQIAVDG